MAYLQLRFELGTLTTAAAEDICFAHGALSVSYGDARDDAVLEPLPGEMRLWPHTRVQALFAAERADPLLVATLAAALGVPLHALDVQAVAERVWEREWLRDFHARRFGRRLWVCPRHETVTQTDAVVVRLDPGLAFGTGGHASTALCLRWLDAQTLDAQTVIDYGCGSGVLAIAALKLGAHRAYAFDIDPQALTASGENATDNAVSDRLRICERTEQLPCSDVLLANILADTLITLNAPLAALVHPGGTALLAGILDTQAAEVAAAYAKWFDMHHFATQDGWVALTGRRLASRT